MDGSSVPFDVARKIVVERQQSRQQHYGVSGNFQSLMTRRHATDGALKRGDFRC
jgi:hypothetical protein